jgi:boron transporter
LIAQGTEFPLRKPAGFHWDIFLLGLTTGVAGLLGIPFPNGLIPQAPFHTESLCVTKVVADTNEEGAAKGHVTTKVSHVVEQRVSNLAQGLLTLGTMTGPLLIVLHLIPQGVLAGLFFVMGVQALSGNGITLKLLFLCRDRSLTPASEPLKRIRRRSAVWAFVAIQLLGFGATFAITQTIAAVGFPIIILLLVPVRTLLLPKWFTADELRVLDAPTASPFTMVSVGGNYGEEEEEEEKEDEDPQPTPGQSGEDTAIPSRDEMETDTMPIGDLAERGELPRAGGNGTRRRSSRVIEDGNIEMQSMGMNRRSASRPSS